MVFHRSQSDNKSLQVSRTLLGILADLTNALVWMVFTRPLISKSSSPCTNLLVTVPKTSITIGIIVTFMFQIFFNSFARFRHLSFFSLSFSFIPWSAGIAKGSFFVVYYKVRSSVRAKVIPLLLLLLLLLLHIYEFFTSALANGFSLEFE